MPLTDLVRYFNSADRADDSMLYLEGERAAAWHQGLRLGSLFEPIVDLAGGAVVGHRAVLTARREDGTPVAPSRVFAGRVSGSGVVALDRLCRTLHALNFLVQQRYAGGFLQVAVHGGHLLAVPNQHGLVYEAILRRCGLAPEDIVLEIDAPAAAVQVQVAQALTNYRRRGYRLALAGTPVGEPALSILAPEWQIVSADALAALPDAGSSIALQVAGIDTQAVWQAARQAGAGHGRGRLFGPPAFDCRATHSPAGVAYNAAHPTLESVHENRQ